MASVETLKKMLDPLVDAHERGSSGRGAGPERRATLPFAPPLYHSDSRALLHQLQSLRRPELNRAPEQRTRTSPMITLLRSYGPVTTRSEEHTSELQSLMRISYAVFCFKKKTKNNTSNQCRKRPITADYQTIITLNSSN